MGVCVPSTTLCPSIWGISRGALTVDYGVAYFTLESREEAAAILRQPSAHAPLRAILPAGLYFKGTVNLFRHCTAPECPACRVR